MGRLMGKTIVLAKGGLSFHISFYVFANTQNPTAYYRIREIHLLKSALAIIILRLLVGGMVDFQGSFRNIVTEINIKLLIDFVPDLLYFVF